jgi:hypothetical protein
VRLSGISIRKFMSAVLNAKHSSASQEWLTPPSILEPAREVLGRIDVDPASSQAGNRLVPSQGRPLDLPALGDFILCAPKRRIRFLREDGSPGPSPTHSSFVAYVPGAVDRTAAFVDAFRPVGCILRPA